MNTIEFGDCRETMARWAAEGVKVQTCITSPPYYGLRDYGHSGQIGLEESPEEFIENLVDVFRHVRNILADDGVIWVNIGDSYYNYRPGKGQALVKQTVASNDQDLPQTCARRGNKLEGLKEKDLIGIPWMLAFALRADGWYLRQDIIWHKPNPMPESVRDRCTKAHEYIFLLSKSKNYYYDNEAIKVLASQATIDRNKYGFKGAFKGQFKGTPGEERWQEGRPIDNPNFSADGKANKRSVWTVNTKPYKGAHFAVYPQELIEPCILAGTSAKGHCPECGSRWVREVKRTRLKRNQLDPSDPRYRPNTYDGKYGDINGKGDAGYTATETIGWKPTCKCGHDPVPDIVLDPFMGSGTTAAVAVKHRRKYLGCELNKEYESLQRERITLEEKVIEEEDNRSTLEEFFN